MNQEQIQQAARDEALVLTVDKVKMSTTNMRIDPTLTQKEETYQVILDIIKNSPCYNAFLITADVPEIYMQQFWFTFKKVKKSSFYQFDLNDKKCQVDVELFRKILYICPRVPEEEFIVPPSEEALITFLYELGYKDTMLTYEIKNSKAYQRFIALSTGLIPPNKGRGKGSKGKRAIVVTPRKKRSITVEANIIPDLEEALISIAKVVIEIDSGSEDDSAQSDDKHVNEGEFEWLSNDDEEKVKDDDEDDMDEDDMDEDDDDMSIDIEETDDDERTDSDNDDQVMHDAEKNDAERAEEERDADKEVTRDEQAIDDQAEDDQVGDLIKQEIPTVPSALLLNVLVFVIPEQPTPPTPTPLATSLPTPPITSEAPPITTTVIDPLPAVIQRSDDLERKFDAWTKVDHSKAIEASLQDNVINKAKNQLPKAVKELVESRTESMIKLEHASKQKWPKHSTTPFDQTSENEYKQKDILFQMIMASKSYEKHSAHKALYDALIQSLFVDEDDMDRGIVEPPTQTKSQHDDQDKDPSTESNQGKTTKRRRTKESEPSMKSSTSKETSKGNTSPRASKTDKPVNAKETVAEPTEEAALKTNNALKNDWFKQPPRPPTPDSEWNKGKAIEDGPEQTWYNDLVSVEKDPLTFDELMATPIDFSKFPMNRLKLEKITKADLVGPVYKLLKGTCQSSIELEYNMEECYKALSDQLDWANPEGIEDMTMKQWSVVKVGYNKDAEYGISHWGPKRYVTVDKQFGYGYLKEIVVRRADRKLYTFKEGDFINLHLNDIEDMLLLVVQQKLFHLDGDTIVDLAVALQPYTPSFDPQGVVYEDLSKRKRLMRADELYKFSDRTLNDSSAASPSYVQNTFEYRCTYAGGAILEKMKPSRYKAVKDRSNVRIGIMPTKTELALEQTQQGVSNEVLNIRVILHSIHSDDGNPTSAIKQALRQEVFKLKNIKKDGYKIFQDEERIAVIMEYLVNISKRRAFWSLNKDILKITILKTNTPYPSRKIQRIRVCTHQRPQRKQVQYAEAARQLLEQAPCPSKYVHDPMELEDHVPVYIHEPKNPEDLVPAEDEAPIEPYITEDAFAPTPPLPPPSLLPTLIRPSHTRAAMAQRRAIAPSIYHSLLLAGMPPLLPIPLLAPSTSRRADIPKADTPPRKRLLLTAPTPRVKVGESSAAAATRQPGSTMARRVDHSFVDTIDTREDRAAMRAKIEILRRERLAYDQESIKTRQALARSEAYSRALVARIRLLETQVYHHEWQHQDTDDRPIEHIIRTQALEAGARVDTLEDTGSSA
ncbi:hypothetical protein Tco_0625646 [Tanacetum coccineum]|uniref:Uncharacterized protein n=1 Tax=Tanacetum coccineum TaxID=301880 RepID=A0ABQ4WHF2_9ASTR